MYTRHLLGTDGSIQSRNDDKLTRAASRRLNTLFEPLQRICPKEAFNIVAATTNSLQRDSHDRILIAKPTEIFVSHKVGELQSDSLARSRNLAGPEPMTMGETGFAAN